MKKLTVEETKAINTLARALAANPGDRASVEATAEQIAGGKGEHVFKALLDARRGDDTDENEIMTSTLSSLETMMATSPSVAGYLMARLFPVAGGRYFHHVADAIDLHMVASTSAELAAVLMTLAKEGVSPRLQKRYEIWAAQILEAGGRAP